MEKPEENRKTRREQERTERSEVRRARKIMRNQKDIYKKPISMNRG